MGNNLLGAQSQYATTRRKSYQICYAPGSDKVRLTFTGKHPARKELRELGNQVR